MNIAFIGNFSEKKGSRLFASLLPIEAMQQHNWYIFGYVVDQESYSSIKPAINKTIAYEDGQLPELLKQNSIDLALTLSIWPETYSKTFFESMANGVPCVTTNYGFPATFLPSWPLICPVEDGTAGVARVIGYYQNQAAKVLEELKLAKSKLEQLNPSADRKFRLIDQVVDGAVSA